MKAQRVEMAVCTMHSPADTVALEALFRSERVRPESVIAMVGKTEGTGLHDDYGRQPLRDARPVPGRRGARGRGAGDDGAVGGLPRGDLAPRHRDLDVARTRCGGAGSPSSTTTPRTSPRRRWVGLWWLGVVGDTAVFVSGGEKNSHQGPPDASPVAAVIRMR